MNNKITINLFNKLINHSFNLPIKCVFPFSFGESLFLIFLAVLQLHDITYILELKINNQFYIFYLICYKNIY